MTTSLPFQLSAAHITPQSMSVPVTWSEDFRARTETATLEEERLWAFLLRHASHVTHWSGTCELVTVRYTGRVLLSWRNTLGQQVQDIRLASESRDWIPGRPEAQLYGRPTRLTGCVPLADSEVLWQLCPGTTEPLRKLAEWELPLGTSASRQEALSPLKLTPLEQQAARLAPQRTLIRAG